MCDWKATPSVCGLGRALPHPHVVAGSGGSLPSLPSCLLLTPARRGSPQGGTECDDL